MISDNKVAMRICSNPKNESLSIFYPGALPKNTDVNKLKPDHKISRTKPNATSKPVIKLVKKLDVKKQRTDRESDYGRSSYMQQHQLLA